MFVRALCVVALVVCAGCDTASPAADSGVDSGRRDDAGPPADSGPDPDGGPPPDGGSADSGTDLCGASACASGQVCLRDVCVGDCGADTSGWDEALAESLRPVAVFCRPALARSVRDVAGVPQVWDVTSATTGTETVFTLSRWSARAGEPISTATVASATVDPSDGVFTGSYVEVSPDGANAIFGYTVFPVVAGGAADSLLHVQTASGAVSSVPASGNFDAAWLSDGVFLLNGLGLGSTDAGQGLYAGILGAGGALGVVQVATGLGFASGSVAVGADYVLVGGFFEGFESRLYVLARAEVEAVIAGTRAMIDVETEAGTSSGVHLVAAMPSVVELVGTRIVVAKLDETFTVSSLRAHPIVAYSPADGVTLSDAEELATGAIFDAAYGVGTRRWLLAFSGGVLLVER